MSLARTRSILLIGLGELGSAVVDALLAHPLYDPSHTRVAIVTRPASLSHPTPAKQAQQQSLQARGVSLVAGDIDHDSEASLRALFRGYSAVLHVGGMTSPPGTMRKVTQAVLQAGVAYYMPWQYGVDYDAIGRAGGQGMFSEQIDVRDTLRAQAADGRTRTDWVIVSCGIFTSFLFEEFWGVVQHVPAASASGRDGIRVTALNSWADIITTTTATDIGRCVAELLFSPDAPVNQAVYIAGDTLTYDELAATIARATGQDVERQVWPLEELRRQSHADPGDPLKKYRVVFAEGIGLSWPRADTWSAAQGLPMETVEEWVRTHVR